LSDLLPRVGGLTLEAFPEGASLFRKHQNKDILLVTRLDQILSNAVSKYNYLLQDGDRLVIPKNKAFVSIRTMNTKAKSLYPEKYLESAENVTVEYPNGAIKRARNILFFTHYPIVENGSIIAVGAKPPRRQKQKKERTPINWEKVISNTFQVISLGLTTALLVRQL